MLHIAEVVDERAAAFAREYGLAGLAVGVVRDGELVHTAGIGHASIGRSRPVTPRSVFRVGSISKIFTALAIMQLVAEGRLDLDAPVNDVLTRYRVTTPPGAPPVTARHLLTHTSGIGELRQYSDVFRPFIGMAVTPGQPIPTLGDYYAPALHTQVPAGRKWAYANHGFATLGAIVEDVTGESFADYMRREVLDAIGMTGSDFLRNERVTDELCDGYTCRRGRNKPARDLELVPAPAGSLFSSVDDMARYIATLCDGGGKLIATEGLEEMLSPQFRIDPRLPPMGLAFFLSELEGHRIAGHDGGVPGFVSYLRFAPDDGVGVMVFTNSNNVKISLAIDGFGDELLRAALGLPDAASAPEPAPVAETPAVWPELCGTYGLQPGFNSNLRPWMMLGGEVEVFERDDHLELRWFAGPARGPARLHPVDASDPLRFASSFGAAAIDVAFTDGAIHIGQPLNVTLFRRRHSFRRRSRVALLASGALAMLTIGAIARRARRHR